MHVESSTGAVAGSHPARAPIARTPRNRIIRSCMLLVLLGLLYAGSAWADSLALLSGGGQAGLIGQPGSKPLVIELRNADGVAIPGRTISWSTGNGFQLGTASSVTDANGQASVTFTFGNYGTTDIVATDATSNASMHAPETSVGSDSITILSGDGQTGQAGMAAAQPIVVQVLICASN